MALFEYLPRPRRSALASLVALALSPLTLTAQNVERLVGCHAFNGSSFFWSSYEEWSQTRLGGSTGLIELLAELHPRQDLIDARQVRVPSLLDTLERERVAADSYWRPIATDSVEITWTGGRRPSVLRLRVEGDTLLSQVRKRDYQVPPGDPQGATYRVFGERVNCPSPQEGRVRLPEPRGTSKSRGAKGVFGCYSFPSRPFMWSSYEAWSRTVLHGDAGLIELRGEANPKVRHRAGARAVRVPGLLDPEEIESWDRSSWRLIGRDSLEITWHNGLYGPWFGLRIRGDSLLGATEYESDIIGMGKPAPKPVTAVRVPCP